MDKTNIEGYLVKEGYNVIEIYNLFNEPVLTYYTKTTSVAVHKLLPLETLTILLYLINSKTHG